MLNRWRNLVLGLVGLFVAACAQGQVFQIQVVDDQTGRGVPLVVLETTNNVQFVTDSNGIVAFDEPGLMDQAVWFSVKSHGYQAAKDGFGFAGVRLTPKRGDKATIRIKRINIAERLYRITGQGIYRDSVIAGVKTPLTQPVINGKVMGQDSAQVIIYRDEIRWFWGDTGRVAYPLGQFAMSGAVAKLPGKGGLDPSVGVDLTYFVDKEGFSRPMAPTKDGGLMWLDGLIVMPDPQGKETLLAHYSRMKDLGTMLEHGLMVYNDEKQVFEKERSFDLAQKWRAPQGHVIRVEEDGQARFYFPAPFGTARVKADWEALRDPAQYEALTLRVENGRAVYEWRKDGEPSTPKREKRMVEKGELKIEQARLVPRDVETKKLIEMHGGSVRWNEYRKKWVLIAVQIGGESSFLGEVWYSEADSPAGPWKWARKVVTHEKYTFYNPVHHAFFDQQGGRIIYFEGTYANTFSGNPVQTPRYDYNQIMYRLDLGDPRLKLPEAE